MRPQVHASTHKFLKFGIDDSRVTGLKSVPFSLLRGFNRALDLPSPYPRAAVIVECKVKGSNGNLPGKLIIFC
jgi:hypothetical protein